MLLQQYLALYRLPETVFYPGQTLTLKGVRLLLTGRC